jgi:hypothetical protein
VTASEIFPILRRAVETPHYTRNPPEYREVFKAARPADLRPYAYDVAILSRTLVEFVAYDMRDNFYGGIGQEIGRFRAKVPKRLTKPDVERAILDAAIAQREAELRVAEALIVKGYADQIRAALDT